MADYLNIESIEGDFITGFRVSEVSCYVDSMIVFSAQEIETKSIIF